MEVINIFKFYLGQKINIRFLFISFSVFYVIFNIKSCISLGLVGKQSYNKYYENKNLNKGIRMCKQEGFGDVGDLWDLVC